VNRLFIVILVLVSVTGLKGGEPKTPVQPPLPPQTFLIKIWIVELAPEKFPDFNTAQDRKQIQDRLVGPVVDIHAKVGELIRNGLIAGTRQISLNAVEGRRFSTSIGEQKKFITDAVITKTGKVGMDRSTTHTHMGIEGTVRADEKSKAFVDLFYSETKAYPVLVYPRDENGKREEIGNPIQVHRFVAYLIKARLTIPAGQAIAATGVQVAMWADFGGNQKLKKLESEQARIVVIVSAEPLKMNSKTPK
jgi:hypothetical protein